MTMSYILRPLCPTYHQWHGWWARMPQCEVFVRCHCMWVNSRGCSSPGFVASTATHHHDRWSRVTDASSHVITGLHLFGFSKVDTRWNLQITAHQHTQNDIMMIMIIIVMIIITTTMMMLQLLLLAIIIIIITQMNAMKFGVNDVCKLEYPQAGVCILLFVKSVIVVLRNTTSFACEISKVNIILTS